MIQHPLPTPTVQDYLKQIDRSIVLMDALAKVPGPGSVIAKQKADALRSERNRIQQTLESVTNS
jgi:hypothetical protein